MPSTGIISATFVPVHTRFKTDNLNFAKDVGNVWFKFSIRNTLNVDTSSALVFPLAVNKAILYNITSSRLVIVGQTGFTLAVLARTIPYEDNRIDFRMKANSVEFFLIQVPRIGFNYMLTKTPVLESTVQAELRAFNAAKAIHRPSLLWSHLFTGIFIMFFLFGLIKFLVLGKDKAYLYYAFMGLFSALMSICQAEYPPFELPWFINLRGIELFNLLNAIAILMQGMFILEILQLRLKFPRITMGVKIFLFFYLAFIVVYTGEWIYSKQYHVFLLRVNTFFQLIILLLIAIWVSYLLTIRKGFYKFIFGGAVTIFIAFGILLAIRLFDLYHLLPSWLGADKRGSVNHFMQLALFIDMLFYFTALAYRDRQVEKDKDLFQQRLISQLETNNVLREKFTSDLEQQVDKKSKELIEQQRAFEIEKEGKLLADFNRRFSESELKALRSQMNPHFIFNILNTIESYALENNKTAASEMIQKFSRLTRLVLENSMNQYVLFEQDWKALQLYTELEQMRYADKFTIVYDVHDEVLEEDYLIPPMIIQPFVENAIIHGLRNKEEGGGILQISASLQDGYLIIVVEDNGIGRLNAANLQLSSPIEKKSLGIRVTQDRILMFNNLTPSKKAKAEIEDLANGTRVKIWLPQHIN